MVQIPILSGIFSDTSPDFRTSYPRNLVPVPKDTGIAEGYLRPADGIEALGVGPGVSRGGINWNGVLYRVMGTKLVRIAQNGTVTVIGDVGAGGRVTFTYSFDRLAVASGGNLWLYDGTTLAQVTDPDLLEVLTVVWVDGYFMTTDGEFLVVTELNDPFAVNPLKYGSSEIDPDPVVGLLKVRNEIYAVNRYTMEVFTNVGGDLFPFQRIEGAQIQRGAVGTHAVCVYMDSVAFMGGKLNEAPSIFMAANGGAAKIATREIEEILLEYTEAELAAAFLEERSDRAHEHLIVHLPRHCLVFDGVATRTLGVPVWFTLSSTVQGQGRWNASDCIYCYDRWNVAHPATNQFGKLDRNVSSHWGQVIGWEFGTQIMYNEGQGAIFHELELVALTGAVPLGTDPTVWTQYSSDGLTWSAEKPIRAGRTGERNKRLSWLQQGHMRHWRVQKFRGTSDTHLTITRLEARLEPLAF